MGPRLRGPGMSDREAAGWRVEEGRPRVLGRTTAISISARSDDLPARRHRRRSRLPTSGVTRGRDALLPRVRQPRSCAAVIDRAAVEQERTTLARAGRAGLDWRVDGAQGRSRTADTRIFNPLLYQLSYLGAGVRAGRTGKWRVYSGSIRVCPAGGEGISPSGRGCGEVVRRGRRRRRSRCRPPGWRRRRSASGAGRPDGIGASRTGGGPRGTSWRRSGRGGPGGGSVRSVRASGVRWWRFVAVQDGDGAVGCKVCDGPAPSPGTVRARRRRPGRRGAGRAGARGARRSRGRERESPGGTR